MTHPQNEVGWRIENTWDFWVYPAETQMPEAQDILITDTLDEKAVETLRNGGKVLITAAGKIRLGNDVKQTYLPVFWNTSWFKMRPPHTTGAYIESSHPLFRKFPTDNWSNLNWWELLNNAQVMNLREFPADYQSPIQPIDTWHISRKLGMLIEAHVEGGKLLMTTMDITGNLEHRPVARQMRKAIISYMKSEDFRFGKRNPYSMSFFCGNRDLLSAGERFEVFPGRVQFIFPLFLISLLPTEIA